MYRDTGGDNGLQWNIAVDPEGFLRERNFAESVIPKPHPERCPRSFVF